MGDGFDNCDDRHTLIGLEIEQLGIARNNDVGSSGKRTGEHVIVIRICVDDRCNDRRHHDVHNLKVALYQRLRGLPARGYRRSKLFARQHIDELGEQLGARTDQDIAALPYRAEQVMRRTFP